MALAEEIPTLPYTGSELDPILNDIDRLFGLGFYYAAVQIALTIPDICSSLETKKGDQARYKIEARYVRWCKTYLEPKFKWFTGEDCWALRGAVLHNGMLFGHPKQQYDRIILHPPGFIIGESYSAYNGGSKERVLGLGVKDFLFRMTEATQAWFSGMKTNPIARDNMMHLVRTRPQGIPPHINGIPVIA